MQFSKQDLINVKDSYNILDLYGCVWNQLRFEFNFTLEDIIENDSLDLYKMVCLGITWIDMCIMGMTRQSFISISRNKNLSLADWYEYLKANTHLLEYIDFDIELISQIGWDASNILHNFKNTIGYSYATKIFNEQLKDSKASIDSSSPLKSADKVLSITPKQDRFDNRSGTSLHKVDTKVPKIRPKLRPDAQILDRRVVGTPSPKVKRNLVVNTEPSNPGRNPGKWKIREEAKERTVTKK